MNRTLCVFQIINYRKHTLYKELFANVNGTMWEKYTYVANM